jgi:hypothetical protein
MTGLPAWAEREPDEPVLDWMLRLQLSHAAIEIARRPPGRHRRPACITWPHDDASWRTASLAGTESTE